MSLISGRVQARKIIVDIVLADFDPALPAMGMPSGFTSYRGLLDTGATMSSLTRRVVHERSLIRRGKVDIDSVSGPHRHGLYLVSVGFVTGGEHTARGYFMLEDPIDMIDVADNASFDIIVGMDVLERCDFEIKRSGDFQLKL